MSNVLASIVNYKRELLTNLADLKPSEKSHKGFKSALSKPEFGFIMECKKASPSKGLIRESFDLEEIIPLYNQYADAISVLTEERFFQGSYKNLEYVAAHTDKPVLCKDFILEPKQIRQARYYGADAVLLMLSVLTDKEYILCAAEAKKYNMDVLTEVHDEEELVRALNLGSEIIGINNRNLKDLTTSLENTKKLAKDLPKNILLVTESGINTHDDILELAPYADACLVGSSLMMQDNLESAASQLVYGDIKICGITRQQDAELVESMEASQLGVIFAEASKRKVAKPIKTSKKPLIGVFQNQSIEHILSNAEEYQLSGVQLHGNESQGFIDDLRSQLKPNISINKVAHINGSIPSLDYNNIDEILLDTELDKQQGGTGTTFDWSLLQQDTIQSNKSKIRIAGGLNETNVQRLKQLGFSKLDLCSGTESSAGIKSIESLKKIFKNSKVQGRTL